MDSSTEKTCGTAHCPDGGKPCFSAFRTVRWLLSAVALTVYSIAYDWLVHGSLLLDFYGKTPAHLWRTPEEMGTLFPFCFVLPLILALVISTGYRKLHKKMMKQQQTGCGGVTRKSIGYGLWTGMLIGAVEAKSYLYMPIPGSVAAVWFAVETLKGIGTGLVLAAVYQSMKSKATSV